MPTFLTLAPNLLFGASIANAIRSAGAEVRACRNLDAWRTVLTGGAGPLEVPMGGIVDLSSPRETWEPAIGLAAAVGIPIFAFGPHIQGALLKAARQAGAQRVVANSALAVELPKWVARRLAAAPEPPPEPIDADEHAHT